ncbi:MAG TPA: OprD family outer membrane porin [Burkholderiales bacterium]|nr:OprD family outer membrane porin [Burkholderiales bacterium]
MTSYKHVEVRTAPHLPRVAAVWPIATVSLFLLVGVASQAAGQQPPAESVEQGQTPMDEVELANPQPGQPLVPVEPEKKSPFFDDSRISAQARTFYLYRDKYDDSISEAWAIGGSVTYTSGYLADVFRVGATAYTSQPLYAPDDRDGTLLLAPGQEGYTVLGQIYGEVKFSDRLFGAFGRKEYNTPYINKNDARMTPNTFEGVTLYGKTGGKDGAPEWRYGGGYISKIKERNSDEFVSMSVDAGATVERGVYVAGANFKQKDYSIGAANYYSPDIINIFYTEAKYALTPRKLSLSAQFSDQQSTGDNLLTGTAFSTHQWGVKGDLGLGAAVLTLAYTDTADGAAMRNPWSGYPGYTSVQVQDFFRAGESAVMLKAAYDLAGLGFKGASAYALWVHGSGVAAPNFNEDEVDLNLQWNPDKSGPLRGMSFRVRLAHVAQRGGGDPDITDFRFIVNYDFPRP